MNLHRLALALFVLTVIGASPGVAQVRDLSGSMQPGPAPAEAAGPVIGLLADSQLQTRRNYARVWGYRHAFADRVVWVSMRPPALDWAARSMVRAHLARLADRGVEAIFYLGDGANNGCLDELAAGFDPAGDGRTTAPANDQGLLAILAEFRREKNIPVYFVLGNHDLLGVGSTSHVDRRRAFCADATGRGHGDATEPNRALTKAEVIALTDSFNRGNDRFAPIWTYRSSFQPSTTARLCGDDLARQHRTWGCYLAARVDYRGSGPAVQFLLLDTNDWVGVREFRVGSFDQEGSRGAMSFGRDQNGVPSQTGWFERNASEFVPMRVALTHYNVSGLRFPFVGGFLGLSQQPMRLFTMPVPGSRRSINQAGAFLISGHTHHREHSAALFRFTVGCRGRGCEPRQQFRIRELNIGSTTDYTNYSTVARLAPDASAPGAIYYDRVEIERAGCASVRREIASHRFPHRFDGQDSGWRAIGIDPANRHNYRDFRFEQMGPLWLNLESFAGADARRANCIGLYAAALEREGRRVADALD